MKNLGYYHLVSDRPKEEGIPSFIKNFNAKVLETCIATHGKRRTEEGPALHLKINHPALLMRKKSKEYPAGRTSLKWKVAMRNNCTIIGKTQFSKPEGADNVFVGTEENYKETDEPDEQ